MLGISNIKKIKRGIANRKEVHRNGRPTRVLIRKSYSNNTQSLTFI